MGRFRLFLEAEQKMEEEDLRKMLDKMPAKFRDLTKGYKFFCQPGNTLKGDHEHIGENDLKKKVITIAAGWNYPRSFQLGHEIGHIVWAHFVAPFPEKVKKWKSIIKKTKNKLHQDCEEQFAHCFANTYVKL